MQLQMSTLQQNHAVAAAALERKDMLLLQAQKQWTVFESDLKQQLATAVAEKDRLSSVIATFSIFEF